MAKVNGELEEVNFSPANFVRVFIRNAVDSDVFENGKSKKVPLVLCGMSGLPSPPHRSFFRSLSEEAKKGLVPVTLRSFDPRVAV